MYPSGVYKYEAERTLAERMIFDARLDVTFDAAA
jgi:hypothetical protein